MTPMLTAMSAEHLARRMAAVEPDYARNLAADGVVPPGEARAEAARRLAALLPDGVHTAGTLLRTAVHDGVDVGWLWIIRRGPSAAWLHNIEVDPDQRGRGYGTAMIEAVEEELVRLGVRRLRLNVFGWNRRALRMYERLGFEATALTLSTPVPLTVLPPLVLPPPVLLERAVAAGPATDRVLVRTAMVDGIEVGRLRVTLPPPPARPAAWIGALEVDPPHRGRGHGRAMIAALDAELRARGVRRLGVHVPGSRRHAVRLFAELGFEVVRQHMAKELTGLSPRRR